MLVKVRSKGPLVLNTRKGSLYLYPRETRDLDPELLQEPEVARQLAKGYLREIKAFPVDNHSPRYRSTKQEFDRMKEISRSGPRVLILRTGGLGDLLLLRPGLLALRAAFKERIHVTLACKERGYPIMGDVVDRIVDYDDYCKYGTRNGVHIAGDEQFDLIFDLQMAVETSPMLTRIHRAELFAKFLHVEPECLDVELELNRTEKDEAREVMYA